MAGEQVPAQPDIKKVVEEAIGAILKPVLDTVAKWMSALVRSREPPRY